MDPAWDGAAAQDGVLTVPQRARRTFRNGLPFEPSLAAELAFGSVRISFLLVGQFVQEDYVYVRELQRTIFGHTFLATRVVNGVAVCFLVKVFSVNQIIDRIVHCGGRTLHGENPMLELTAQFILGDDPTSPTPHLHRLAITTIDGRPHSLYAVSDFFEGGDLLSCVNANLNLEPNVPQLRNWLRELLLGAFF
jgi:hypothetical protein